MHRVLISIWIFPPNRTKSDRPLEHEAKMEIAKFYIDRSLICIKRGIYITPSNKHYGFSDTIIQTPKKLLPKTHYFIYLSFLENPYTPKVLIIECNSYFKFDQEHAFHVGFVFTNEDGFAIPSIML